MFAAIDTCGSTHKMACLFTVSRTKHLRNVSDFIVTKRFMAFERVITH